jgi:hypothetical protein
LVYVNKGREKTRYNKGQRKRMMCYCICKFYTNFTNTKYD